MNWDLPLDDGGIAARPLELDAICLTEAQQQQAASLQDPADSPEQAWTRYLRALALIGLRRWLKQRRAGIVVGPELEPEAPDRLLAINGRVTQLVCASALADEAEVSLSHLQDPAMAPQLLLLALVDEDHGVVTFPGVLAASRFVDEVRQSNAEAAPLVELPVKKFGGGLERLLRWVTLLSPEALPRAGFRENSEEPSEDLLSRIQDWVRETLASLPPQPALRVSGARSGGKAAEVRLINPLVEVDQQGVAKAMAVCSTPTLWAEGPLAEVQIWRGEELLWRLQATSTSPIEGPISWPLASIEPNEQLLVRLRPYSTSVSCQASFVLVATEFQNQELDVEILEALAGRKQTFLAMPGKLNEISSQSVKLEMLAKIKYLLIHGAVQ